MRALVPLAIGLVVIAGVTVSLVFLATAKGDKNGKDDELILGTWKMDTFDTAGGGGPPAEEAEKIRFVFERGGQLRMVGGPMGREMTGTFSLDPTAKPKAIDLTLTRPDGQEENVFGLYELNGDTLKLCFGSGGDKQRPEEIVAARSTPLVTFTRVNQERDDGK